MSIKSILLRLPIVALVLAVPLAVAAQTAGTYQIEKSVAASGGGTSSGGIYVLQSTAGQPFAGGLLQSSERSAYIGFWSPELSPTAALVTVGGRVRTESGQGVSNVSLSLVSGDGRIRHAVTGSFGYFSFDDVASGETYILTAQSKRFVIDRPTRVLMVVDEISDIDFIAGTP